MPRIPEAQHLDTLHRFSRELIRDYSLESVLFLVAEAAKKIAGARNAAVGIAGRENGFDWYMNSPSEAIELARVEQPPDGWERVETVRKRGLPLRIDYMGEPDDSASFPVVHFPLRASLIVPILVQNEESGLLYLMDKLDGPAFSEKDQQLVETLAAFAAVAIENTQAYARLRESDRELEQRNQELAIFNDITVAASTTLELEVILATTLDRMMLHFNARCGEIFLAEEEGKSLHLEMRQGPKQTAFWKTGPFAYAEGFIGGVAAAKDVVELIDPPAGPSFSQEAFRQEGLRMLIGLPLISKSRVLGVVSLALREPMELSERQRILLQAVGLSVGTALENGLLHRTVQRVAVLEERERIGMDLHDGIIQSIYAVGLTLEDGLLDLEKQPEAIGEKIQRAIDNLNTVIRDIRAYIMDLRPRKLALENIASGLKSLAHEFRVNSLAEIEVNISDEASAVSSRAVSNALFHIAQEALANAARHSHATRVRIELSRSGSEIVLFVEDNGFGFDPATKVRSTGHGMDNMQDRTNAVGGELKIRSAPGEGTAIRVTVPTV